MFGRLFRRNPHTRERAVALIVSFLKQHKDRIFIETFARHTGANVKARGVDAALDGYGPYAQAQVGHYNMRSIWHDMPSSRVRRYWPSRSTIGKFTSIRQWLCIGLWI